MYIVPANEVRCVSVQYTLPTWIMRMRGTNAQEFYVHTSPVTRAQNALVATFLTTAICIGFLLFAPQQMFHWATLPVAICGVIIGCDLIAWLRGQYDAFDAIGVVGAFGYHFFFLSPLLMMSTNEGIAFTLDHPADYRPTIGLWALVTCVGLMLYSFISKRISREPHHFGNLWSFDSRRTYLFLLTLTCLALLCQLYVFASHGITGGFARETGASAERGSGVPSIIGRSFFLLSFFLVTLPAFRSTRIVGQGLNWALFVLSLPVMLLASFGASSRGMIVLPLFWATCLAHYLWKPFKAMHIAIGVAIVLLFGWWHAFYKSYGLDFYSELRDGRSIADLADESGRTIDSYLLGDMSRIRIQAYLLYHELNNPGRYDYALGSTYLLAPTVSIPTWLWPDKPSRTGKVLASTRFMRGRGDYRQAGYKETSSHAYGIVGEAMLNFGPWSMPLAYAMWGLAVGLFRKYCNGIRRGDMRILILPLFAWWGFQLLLWDSDNYVGHNVNRAIVPALAVWLATVRTPCSGTQRSPNRNQYT